MLRLYDISLQWVLHHARLTLTASAIILAATVYLFVIIPKGFFPSEDTSRILIQTEAAEDISFNSMIDHQQQVAAIVQADPRVDSYMSTIGARGNQAASGNTGVVFARLKPRSKRDASADQIIEQWRPQLAAIPGIRCFLMNIPPIMIGGRLAKSQYQYTIQGPDTAELYRLTPMLADRLRPLPGFQDVATDLQLKNPKIKVEMDRDKLSAMQVSAEQVEMALGSAYGAKQISTIYGTNNQYQVILEVEREFQRNPDALALLHVRSADGHLVPLEALAKITQTVGPLSVNHLGQLPAVTVSFNLAPGYALGPAVEQVQRISREILPATITGTFQGAAQAFQSSQQGLQALLIVSIVVIYLVLGILYESFIHPITILTALPFAGFGALLTLMAFGIDLNLYAFVGVIMLVGLVKKNGIMMVDFAIDAQKGGSPADEAIYAACLVRFRPIMMTTMAALMGTLPIAMGFGAGAESRRPLGLAVVGGLLFSQSLTLFVTPVFYIYAERMQAAFTRWRARKRTPSRARPHTPERETVANLPSDAAVVHP
jgi:HAE1 family hydrophobic/amphiphilic exporter-1